MNKIQPDIFIIIINWNGLSDTIECVQSLKNVKYKNLYLKIIDNSPDNKDYFCLKEKFPESDIEKVSDSGFSAANNVGIKQALNSNFQYVLLLNNDTIVEEDFLEKLVSDPDLNTGIYSPKICYYSNKNLIWSAGGSISVIRATGSAPANGKNRHLYNENKYVSFVSGCCMLIRSDVFRSIGLFDEQYFLYVEDADICERALKAGFKIKYISNSIIYHKVSSSTTKTETTIPLYYTTRNRLYFANKFYPEYLFFIKFYIYLVMVIKGIGWLIKGNSNNVKAVLNAVTDFKNVKMGKRNRL